MDSEQQANVLYVDDEQNSLSAFKASFRRSFNIFIANSGAEAQKILAENEIHVLISDQKMPGMQGVELLEDALKKYPDQVRILLTAYSDFEILRKAVNSGYIFKYLIKPWNDDELMAAITQAYALYMENLRSKKLALDLEQKKNALEEQLKILEETLKLKREQIDNLNKN